MNGAAKVWQFGDGTLEQPPDSVPVTAVAVMAVLVVAAPVFLVAVVVGIPAVVSPMSAILVVPPMIAMFVAAIVNRLKCGT